jgi:2-methylcitrate dehydratase PrpD
LDSFIHIIEENGLEPEDIEKVEYTPQAIELNRMWKENELRSEEDFGFHGPYLIACAAHRIKRIDFQNPNVRGNLRIREFMKKVKVLPLPHRDFGSAMIDDPSARVFTIEVSAKGKTIREETGCTEGVCRLEGFKATDGDLVEKFNEAVSPFLPSDKIARATDTLLNLKALKDVKNLMATLVP